MKGTRRIMRTVVVLLAAVFAFVLGYAWQSLSDPDLLIRDFSHVADRLVARSGRSPAGIPVVETYSDTLQELQKRHYQPVNETQITYSAISGMLSGLGDPYTRFMTPEAWSAMEKETAGEYVGVGATLDPSPLGAIVKRPLPNSPCMAAGIKAGDLIIAVDSKPVAGMDIEDIVRMIRGEEGTPVTLTIERRTNGELQTKDFRLVRARVDLPTVEYRMLSGAAGRVGYVSLSHFNEKASDALAAALSDLRSKGMNALVLDLRDDPGGLLTQAVAVAGQFLNGKSVVIVKERDKPEKTIYTDPGMFRAAPPPMVVLVNKNSASASEIVAGALKDHRVATIVGEKTFGKGLVQTLIDMRNGSAVAITTARYYTPNHTDINGKTLPNGERVGGGLPPDVEVAQSKDYVFGEDATDAQLQKALEVLAKQGRPGG
ncbi:MAG: peptidase S41 [Fimbriimonadales bacterium]